MKYYLGILLFLASLTFSSGLRAQYSWHVALPAQIDSFLYRGITSISCKGENCTATEVIYTTIDRQRFLLGDSNVILSSHDGGVSWFTVAAGIPQWKYDSSGMNRQGLYYYAAQQIDSLNAIAADKQVGVVLITHDGWKTWRVDSSYKDGIHGVYFANAAEGILQEPFGFYWSTVDSGNHWRQEVFNSAFTNGIACQSYGDSMFRVFSFPNMIFTTHDNWNSWDTTYINPNGPLEDTSFHASMLFFGADDTLAIEGWRWDVSASFQASLAMALSDDFGVNWKELDVPRNNGIYFGTSDQLSLDWKHMVMAGSDSIGRIVQSFDAGVHWECDTIPLSSGIPYYRVVPFAVTGSGRVLAGILDDSSYMGSSSLVYLESDPLSVNTPAISPEDFTVFPNPATTEIQVASREGNISILDPLGLSYEVNRIANTLDISSLPSGVYFVSDGVSRAKFVKE